MPKKTTGKSYREGLSLVEMFQMFPDDAAAEKHFILLRWSSGIACPYCGSMNVQTNCKHKTMPFRCREKECAKRFSTKTGTLMEGSKLGFQTWIIAIYLLTTSLKSVSSLKLSRDLKINQRSAWFLAHRIRLALDAGNGLFSGPVEMDETYVGGRRKNMPASKRKNLQGRGSVGKIPVIGMKDRKTKKIAAAVVADTSGPNLQGFVSENTQFEATVYTDDSPSYKGLPNHESVKHSVGEYVKGQAHINGIESFWSMLKRAHKGTFHQLSAKHLDRYVQEFSGRHNIREMDTVDQLNLLICRMDGRRLLYRELIG